MASDGTNPTHLPPGAKAVILNDTDVLTNVQVLGGLGPFTVPAGKRLVITSIFISFVERNAGAGTRLLTVSANVENDGNPNTPPGTGRVLFGLAVPPVANAMASAEVRDLAVPVAAGGQVSSAGWNAPAGPNQIVLVSGYLENVPA